MLRAFLVGLLTTTLLIVWLAGIAASFAAAAMCGTALGAVCAFAFGIALTGGIAAMIFELMWRL